MNISFNTEEITEKDYNFIVSNLILSQRHKFTYYSILEQLKIIFRGMNTNLKYSVERALVRLREDGFLNVLGSNYWVVDSKV